MDADDGYFDERVAARYDDSAAEMFDPAVVRPVVDLLVGRGCFVIEVGVPGLQRLPPGETLRVFPSGAPQPKLPSGSLT